MPERPTPRNATEALGLLRTAASDYEPREWVQGAYEDGLRFVAELEAALRDLLDNFGPESIVRAREALADTEGEQHG
jgi:hypothetical protein